MPEETQLALASATFQELIDELFNRCTACILVAERPAPVSDPTENDSTDGFWRKGSYFTNIGMLNCVTAKLSCAFLMDTQQME